MNTIDARPRGPNQPMKSTVSRRRPEPINDRATGSIRITVRLSRAYTTALGVSDVNATPASATPKMKKAIWVRSSPSRSRNS